MSKYHLSKKGYYSECKAVRQPCPLSGGHISEGEYEQLKASNSPTVETNFAADPNSYYVKAKAQYEGIVERENASVKINQQVIAETDKLSVEAGLDPAHTPALYELDQELRGSKAQALNRLRELYVEEGVSPLKAGFITGDIAKKDKITPVVKRKDSRDPEIGDKTKKAVERAKTDEEFQRHTADYDKAADTSHKLARIHMQASDLRRELSLAAGVRLWSGFDSSERANAAKTLQSAIAWKQAGVPDSATTSLVSKVKQEEFSVDSRGEIDNAWVEVTSGKIEKVISYVPASDNSYGNSGHLVTENGTKVSSSTHYHSYKQDQAGTSSIIFGPHSGSSLSASSFSVHSVMDSGD